MVSGLVVLEVVRVICSEGGGRGGGGGGGGGGEVQRGGAGTTEEEGGGGVRVGVFDGGPGHGGVLQSEEVETKMIEGEKMKTRREKQEQEKK